MINNNYMIKSNQYVSNMLFKERMMMAKQIGKIEMV